MGYTTDFEGSMSITPPLSKPQVEYLQAFSETRRMKRSNTAEMIADDKREAVGLPLGDDAGYFVGGEGSRGQEQDPSVISYNSPPSGQPGLWCQWTVDDDGENLMWDENEKFYNYAEWLEYLVEHFLKPWGCELNGQIEWSGEDDSDKGIIYAKGFAIEAVESKITNAGPSWTSQTFSDGSRMTQATNFIRLHGNDAATVMTALDTEKVPSNQDWDNETTTWTFDDGSQIVVNGSQMTVKPERTETR